MRPFMTAACTYNKPCNPKVGLDLTNEVLLANPSVIACGILETAPLGICSRKKPLKKQFAEARATVQRLEEDNRKMQSDASARRNLVVVVAKETELEQHNAKRSRTERIL